MLIRRLTIMSVLSFFRGLAVFVFVFGVEFLIGLVLIDDNLFLIISPAFSDTFLLIFSPAFDIPDCIAFFAVGLAIFKTFEATFLSGLNILSTIIPDPLC